MRAYDEATVRNDVAALAQLVADDYMLVARIRRCRTSSRISKTQVPGFKLIPTSRAAGAKGLGDTALVAGLVDLSWTGTASRPAARAAHVWRKQADGVGALAIDAGPRDGALTFRS